jgi:hypothetical protein
VPIAEEYDHIAASALKPLVCNCGIQVTVTVKICHSDETRCHSYLIAGGQPEAALAIT